MEFLAFDARGPDVANQHQALLTKTQAREPAVFKEPEAEVTRSQAAGLMATWVTVTRWCTAALQTGLFPGKRT